MSKLQKDIEELKQRHASTTAKMMEHRRKLADLSHRILKVSLISCRRIRSFYVNDAKEAVISSLFSFADYRQTGNNTQSRCWHDTRRRDPTK